MLNSTYSAYNILYNICLFKFAESDSSCFINSISFYNFDNSIKIFFYLQYIFQSFYIFTLFYTQRNSFVLFIWCLLVF